MAKERVNGRYLSQKIGEDVILLGTISRKSSNGKSIELLTTDSMKVNVTFDQPLSGNDEGYIEVHGVAQSKGTISCKNYILFPPNLTCNFQANQYNDLCSVLHLVGSKKWSLSTDYGL
ncbi:PREDICTED: uncharacterized protein LOC107064166 isoform X1 [Polistes dominula]|uniref:Uncharacterized protein LOC107064166 isoform X1 n=1 Tax=Polistes dominula TaxID=743375 RepID=A0ABM1HVQ7_POLDO|nr:PREDICTED: uncharacterized protein LOC107064166 isoform X1 [Polistes dominula]